MKRNFFVLPLVVLAAAMACRSSAVQNPTLVPQSTQTPGADSPTEIQPTASFFDSGESPQQLLQDVVERAQDIQRDVTYCTVNDVALKMDVYFPKNTSDAMPLVIYIHGGGWSRGDKGSRAGMTDVPALLDAGFTVASLNYRMAPKYQFPAMLEDVKCAIRSFRANADTYRIDPNRIGLWGDSAGAHLSNMIGLTDQSAGFEAGEYLDQSSRVQAVIDISGPTDLTVDFSPAFIEAKSNAYVGYDMMKASPVTYITPDDPPFLILQGDKDPVVPILSGQAQKLYDGLLAAGVPAQLVIVQGGPHLLDAPNQTPTRAEITVMIVGFFSQYLK
jgi:acetyl esterase/lipase